MSLCILSKKKTGDSDMVLLNDDLTINFHKKIHLEKESFISLMDVHVIVL